MGEVYNSIMAGLIEAVDDVNGKGEKLSRYIVTVDSVKQYQATEIQESEQ